MLKPNCQIVGEETPKPLVSVIYVNYNTSTLLIDSIDSLKSQCRSIPFEIIIVDNASEEQEKQILCSSSLLREMGDLKLIFAEHNGGFAKANNLGVKNAGGKYLFFLNPDTLVLNDVIGLFYNYLEQSPSNVVACGGNLLRPDLTPNSSYGNFPGLLLELCNIGLGLSFALNRYYKRNVAIGCPSYQEIKPVPYIVGADLFVRTSDFKSAGEFDENYFMYYEETDLFKRFHRSGLKSFILPEARIIHFEGGAVGRNGDSKFNYRKFEMLLKSKVYYYRKWFPRMFWTLKVIIPMQILVQFAKGKWGDDLGRLFLIYRKSFQEKTS